MNDRSDPLSRDVEIINKLGLHARSASRIAQIAQKAKSDVQIIRNREAVDAKSIIDMLTLACAKGTNITVRVNSDTDLEVLNEIVSLVEGGFGE
ncbi:MAG: HPr family phosphocarrier protein [Desulfobacterales bacterium]